MDIDTGVDAISVFLTGGATNANPALSLGGVISSSSIVGLGCKVNEAVPGLRILDVNGTCGEGDASIVCASDTAVFTAPGDTAGSSISLGEEEYAILPSHDTAKTIEVYREADLLFQGTASLSLVGLLRGVLSMGYVEDTERQAGSSKYRAIAITNNSESSLLDINISIANPSEIQSTYSFGSETPIGGEVQSIVDEDTPPSGISFYSLLTIPLLLSDETIVTWIQREFPSSGTVSAKESPIFSITFQGE